MKGETGAFKCFTGALRSPKEQQQMENEIAEALGWQTFTALTTTEVDALRERWPEIRVRVAQGQVRFRHDAARLSSVMTN